MINPLDAGEVIQMVASFKDLFSAPPENGIHSCPEKIFTTIGGITVTMRNVLLVAFDAQQDFASKQGKIFSPSAETNLAWCFKRLMKKLVTRTCNMQLVTKMKLNLNISVTDCRSTYFQRDFTYIVRRNDTGIPCTLARMSINATVLYKKGDSQVSF